MQTCPGQYKAGWEGGSRREEAGYHKATLSPEQGTRAQGPRDPASSRDTQLPSPVSVPFPGVQVLLCRAQDPSRSHFPPQNALAAPPSHPQAWRTKAGWLHL